MGDILTMPAGGGGVTSDEVTVTRNMIPTGYKALTADSNDEVVTGTLTLTGNVSEDKVLSGYTFYGVDAQRKRTGTLTIASIVNFKIAQYSNLTLISTWALPSKGPWSGVRIMCKLGSYPSSVSDGTLFYEGVGTSVTKQLGVGRWCFKAWNYITTNRGRMFGGHVQAVGDNNPIKGKKVFTFSQNFVVPDRVRSIDIFMVGGGGGVTQDYSNSRSGAGGGYTATHKNVSVSPGQSIAVSIGAGGDGGNGGSTTVGSYTVAGGLGVRGSNVGSGAAGGSGGGGRSNTKNEADPGAGDGGSDGANGGDGHAGQKGGTGQNRSTKAFGESSGSLYAGGGGGYGATGASWTKAGMGGAGGGGDAAPSNWGGKGLHGAANTGGGGAGIGYQSDQSQPLTRSRGGSGIAIIRWGYEGRTT